MIKTYCKNCGIELQYENVEEATKEHDVKNVIVCHDCEYPHEIASIYQFPLPFTLRKVKKMEPRKIKTVVVKANSIHYARHRY